MFLIILNFVSEFYFFLLCFRDDSWSCYTTWLLMSDSYQKCEFHNIHSKSLHFSTLTVGSPSPAGKPSQISNQSNRQRAPGGDVVSGSMSKLSNSTTISDILGAKIIKVQSRLLGYFSGKPGVLMTPRGAVKFLEHSGPAQRNTSNERLRCRDVFGPSD